MVHKAISIFKTAVSTAVSIASVLVALQAHALTPIEAKSIAVGETDARVEALNKAMLVADEKTSEFVQAVADDMVKISGDNVFIVKDAKAFDPVTGAEVQLPAALEDIINNNRMRGELDTALAALKLFNKDESIRAAA
ncbi:MAG: hypothetical protein RL171_1200, partial [Pseudomonadota bacterium]